MHELSKRETEEREIKRPVDQLYALLWNECQAQRILLEGIPHDPGERSGHTEYTPVPWRYFLRPVTHTMGTGFYGSGTLSPPYLDKDPVPVFSADGDRRAIYREVQIKRDDVLRLKATFNEMTAQSSDVDDPVAKEAAKPTAKVPRRGRKKGTGSFAAIDEPRLEEMAKLIQEGRAASPEAAALQVAPRAHGTGTLKSRVDRLAKRYRAKYCPRNKSD
jgi:hypothetical protein